MQGREPRGGCQGIPGPEQFTGFGAARLAGYQSGRPQLQDHVYQLPQIHLFGGVEKDMLRQLGLQLEGIFGHQHAMLAHALQ